jgi:hypothetical protein
LIFLPKKKQKVWGSALLSQMKGNIQAVPFQISVPFQDLKPGIILIISSEVLILRQSGVANSKLFRQSLQIIEQK